jgi:hypothetical protein
MRNEADPMLLRHPRDLALLAEPAHFRDVGLDDIQSAALQPWPKTLTACQHLAPGDRHVGRTPQRDILFSASGTSGSSNQSTS